MRIAPRALALLATLTSARAFGLRATDWTSLGGLECSYPATCTAIAPWQVGFDTGGVSLALSQKKCFAPDGSNDPSCCSGATCAAWAGASVQSTDAFSAGVLELVASLNDPDGVSAVESIYPIVRCVSHHTESIFTSH